MIKGLVGNLAPLYCWYQHPRNTNDTGVRYQRYGGAEVVAPSALCRGEGEVSHRKAPAGLGRGLLWRGLVSGNDETCAAVCSCGNANYFMASSTATAQATVAPTMGLLPMPMRPIMSTCAGTELEPANWALECMRPMVSVMP